MRISSGELKGRVLRLPKGSRSRPATSFAAELAMNLFTLERLAAGVFLDLCAGSGLLGFEALSRGAPYAIFVEADERQAAAILESAEAFSLRERCCVLRRDARRAARKVAAVLAGRAAAGQAAAVSCAFVDPPYIPGMAADILGRFFGTPAGLGLLAPEALVMLRTTDRIERPPRGLRLIEARRAGNGRLWLFGPEA